MKATGAETQRQQGSFGMPQDMKDQVNNFEQKRRVNLDEEKPKVKVSTEKEPVVELSEEEKAEKERMKILERANAEVKRIEDEMGIEITKEDIFTYVRKGRLAKKMEIVPGALSVVLQTLTGADLEEIEKHMGKYRKTMEATSAAIETEQAICNLAFALASYNGRNIDGLEKEKVRDMLRGLAAHQLNKMVTWNNLFNRVVDHRLNDKDFLKK